MYLRRYPVLTAEKPIAGQLSENQSIIMIRNAFLIFLCSMFFLLAACSGHSHDQDTGENNSVTADTTLQVSPQDEQTLRNAAHDGGFETVQRLLKKKVDPNAADEDGRTALMFAAFNGHSDIVELLLDAGAETGIRESFGRTALMYAATGPFPATVKLLLDHGADPNVVDGEEHFTALMHAAAEGQAEVVRVLLNHGANPLLKDIDGDTAESFARRNGHTELADFLRSVMEKENP